MDEAAFYLLAGVVRTYAPCGETPILKVFQTRDPLSVMSGITPAGQLATRTRARALTGLDSVAFLRHLYRSYAVLEGRSNKGIESLMRGENLCPSHFGYT